MNKGPQVELCDDAEVVTTSTQSPVQVRKGCRASGDNDPRSCHNFKGFHIIAGPPVSIGKMGDASSECQSGYADRSYLERDQNGLRNRKDLVVGQPMMPS